MIECRELAGKVIQRCTVFEDGSDGPDLQIDFTDGTTFNLSARSSISIEAKRLQNGTGEPTLLQEYTNSSPRL